jgi:hypothetical protein
MSVSCIHGFQQGQCATCSPVDSRPADSATDGTSEERQGWEIFYVPAVSGWQLRSPEATVVPDSYRSLFLARKAVDHMIANPPPARPAKRGR